MKKTQENNVLPTYEQHIGKHEATQNIGKHNRKTHMKKHRKTTQENTYKNNIGK